jgi:hypothetical protein
MAALPGFSFPLTLFTGTTGYWHKNAAMPEVLQPAICFTNETNQFIGYD